VTNDAIGTKDANDSKGENKADSRLLTLLSEIGLPTKPGSNDDGALDPGAEEVQALKAGVTKATAWVTKVITGAGGLGAVLAAVGAYLAKQNSGMQIALVASAAGILAAAALSLAVVIGADLLARARATAAQYHALGQVVAAYEAVPGSGIAQQADPAPQNASGALPDVLTSELSISLLAVAASGRQMRARIEQTGEWLYIIGVTYEGGHLKVRMSPTSTDNTGPLHDLSEIDEFETGASGNESSAAAAGGAIS
jgi:hypothetical protein